MGRLVTILAVLVVLGAAAAVLWVAFDLPPLKLVVRHGFPPAGGPTGRTLTIEGVTFVELGTGYFRMGSWLNCTKGDFLGRICKALHLPWGNQPRSSGVEAPVHWVRIARPYWMAVSEVTNEQYERFEPQRGSARLFRGDRDPVVQVNWEDARRYCDWLSTRGSLSVRLPSESEWENAARAGSISEYSFGDDWAALGSYGWYNLNSDGRAQQVMTRRPNSWGLHDLHGNVWEWVEDRWHDNYEGAPDDGSAWTDGTSSDRVMRGGSWHSLAPACSSTCRGWFDPPGFGDPHPFRRKYRGMHNYYLGFRPAAESR